MINFCNEPDVSAAIILKGDYFIFRSDQYWLFDGELTFDSTPFGNLVDGALFAVNKWRAFDQTKEGVFAINNKVYVYKKEKSYFAPIMKGGILTTEVCFLKIFNKLFTNLFELRLQKLRRELKLSIKIISLELLL